MDSSDSILVFVAVEKLQVEQQQILMKSYLDLIQLSLAMLPNFSVSKATYIVIADVAKNYYYYFSELYQNWSLNLPIQLSKKEIKFEIKMSIISSTY